MLTLQNKAFMRILLAMFNSVREWSVLKDQKERTLIEYVCRDALSMLVIIYHACMFQT